MRLDPYFRKAKHFPEALNRLREILLEYPLKEELKWRQPCYTYDGGNVVILHEMKSYCGLGFLRGALIDDPKGVLVAPGKNSQAARQMRFRSVAEIDEQEDTLRAIIESAIAVHKSGQKVDFKAKRELVYPDELKEKMAGDAAFKAAFEALTPGRQRGYILHISDAKQSKTRSARIEKHYDRIMDGLGIHDR
ncbi:YdeI/OmpD-associated family protein [Roseovarius sp.]|uniref:YdeI/OmpD-associated family protein n=1 Tax=Roseovarius sp. TaxID=1486281 RepID=UPI003BAA20D6